jgi:hypothetical protein
MREIVSIEMVDNFSLGNNAKMEGSNGSKLGMMGMLNILGGGRSMDGYKVNTEGHEILLLIDNCQSCCESWGYFSSNDDEKEYIGKELIELRVSETYIGKEKKDEAEYLDEGGIQFVDFITPDGTFQLAVYNGHNGYYGHGIILAVDGEIILDDTL